MSAASESKILPYSDTMEILAKYQIPTAEGGLARSLEDAKRISKRVGYPVALKALSQRVSHKTEANAIKLGVNSDSELLEAYQEVTQNLKRFDRNADVADVLIQEMLRNGTEIIVGTARDLQFGPVIMFGLGGILVEVLQDVSLRILPITRFDAEEMVNEIKGWKILEGFRGKPKADLKAIVDILMKVSRLATDMSESISELDLNPIIVQSEGRGAKVVDARFVTIGRLLEAVA